MNQERLAEAAGLEVTTVQRVESASSNLSIDTLVRIADALDVDPQQLFIQAELAPTVRGRPPKRS